MIIKHKETVKSNFEGTVIDIETIGGFRDQYRDSRRYEEIRMVIFGFLNKNALEVLCAEGERSTDELLEETWKIINGLERSLYAFNSEFERGVFFYNLGMKIDFDGELQKRPRERKASVRRELGIPNYDDPFFDDGYRCMIAWQNREFDKAIAHNRACLLKERDILLKRGSTKPSELEFVGK